MNHSPAEVIARYLASLDPEIVDLEASPWRITVDYMPDKGANDAVAVYNTQGKKDHRDEDGTKFHPGIQVRVRSGTPTDGYQKAAAIRTALDQITRGTIAIDGTNYIIDAVTLTTDILSLGQEVGTNRRLFTLNAITSIAVVA